MIIGRLDLSFCASFFRPTFCTSRVSMQSSCCPRSTTSCTFIARLLDGVAPFQHLVPVANGLPQAFATPEPGRLEIIDCVRRSNTILMPTRSC
ncbi:hypothetical protein IG631_08683 [Alternaria alternata]|nr:hypothetical protein IG631_08683 [Alternaria alternata]